ncbi:MAG: thioesterase family protein [Ignavibacteriaceae bacterium]|jgi:acyl-CoA thioester hydrolase
MNPTKNINLFKHTYDVTVRFDEVDMLNIANNAVYFKYFEQARIKYAKDLGVLPKAGIAVNGTAFYMARNEINYLKVAVFEDKLRIYTRVSFIKHSSFGFEHIIKNLETGKIVAEGAGVLVHVNPDTKKSMPLPKDFYEKISEFEDEVEIINDDS